MLLVFSTTRPWNKQISAPDASQLTSQERWQVAYLKHLKTSDIFSLSRINTKDFPYIKGRINWSTGIHYSSVDFKWTQVFLCCQSFDRRGQWILLKIRVIQDKSKPTSVAMIWLRVKVNRTRLCTTAHFARNEILNVSEELRKRTFPVQPLCMYGLSFIPLYKLKFYKCHPLSPSYRRKAKNYHSQYLWQKLNLVKLFVNRQEI